jgi:hypothetical protein
MAGTLLGARAQDGERLEAIKIAFLTKKLDLSPEEAQRFWPIYNRYTDEIKSIRLEQKQKGTTELDVEDKILAVRKKYNGEFTKAISAEKVNTFFRSEKEFGNAIRREMQERRMERQLERKGLRN